MSNALQVVSFGYGHHYRPPADVTIDLRWRIRDPHTSPELRALTGLDTRVFHRVADHPGVRDLVVEAFRLVRVVAGLGPGLVTVAFGCVGGRHRSVVLAELLHERALRNGWRSEVHHCHIDMPVLDRREDP